MPCYFSGPFYMVTCEICHDDALFETKNRLDACKMSEQDGWRVIDDRIVCPDCADYLELKPCPICHLFPRRDVCSDGQRYRCWVCGDCGEWEINRARAAESWNLGITDEYVKEVKEAD